MKFDISEATKALQNMLNGFVERVPYLVVALIVFVIFSFIAKAVRVAARTLAQRNQKHYSLGLVVGRLAYGVMIFLGLLISLVIAIPGFTPGQLVNILGLSSVAIGFAFRDILQNFLAGILLLLSEPFRIGDQIIVGEFEGTVENIQTRATFIKTYDGRRIVIPNSKLFTDPVTVNTAYEKRRLQYDVGIGYGDDIAHAKQVMLDVLREIPDVLDDPAPDALVVDLASSTVNIRLRWWIRPPRQTDLLGAQDVVLERIKSALTEAGIDLPFDTQVMLIHDQTEETDGNRAQQREGWPAGTGNPPKPARLVDGLKRLQINTQSTRDGNTAMETTHGDSIT
jgi:small-conductance mechanosensitive channel